MVNNIDYVDIKVSKKDYSRVEKENNVCVNVFCYETIWFILLMYHVKKFEKCMDLLLITD